MKQRTLAMMTGFEQYTRKTRRAIFLEEMEQVVPWGELCALVAPHYPQPGKGRRPVGVERMLRIYFLQQWFNLSDPAVEEALYDSAVMRQFVGIDLGCEPVPDETTVCKFRHLLEEHQLGGTDPGAGEPAPAGAGGANHDGHDRGRDHPARTHFDQEPGAAARSGDAPDEEGQTMVLRDEGAREEECHPTVRGGRAGESVLGAEKTVALGTGLARERRLLITGEPPKQAEDRKKPNPSACTGLAELTTSKTRAYSEFP